MADNICEICGRTYVTHCGRCTRRVTTWGNEGTYNLVQMAKRTDDIHMSELIEFCESFYIGAVRTRHEKVAVLKKSLTILGYTGNFIGRHYILENTYTRYRQRENQTARRYRMRKDCCEKCGSKDDLRIHHIVPLAWGGKTSSENIITLCKKCHVETHRELTHNLNRTLLIHFLEPYMDEIKRLAELSISDNDKF